ncbi:AMP-binding protein, partial [Cribrihabitans sp. XS_ASV171]
MKPMTAQEAIAEVLSTNPIFTVGLRKIRGIDYPVFVNIPKDLGALLHASHEAQAGGTAEFLVHGSRRWSYDEYCKDVAHVAALLSREYGVRQGTRVALAMRNCPEMLILMMAIASLGAVVVFLNAWWTGDELNFALRNAEAKLVFADTDRVARLDASKEALTLVDVTADTGLSVLETDVMQGYCAPAPRLPIDPDSDFAIMYSSGTTSHPKGVALTHRGAVNAVYTWLLQAVIAPMVTPPEDPDAPPIRPVTLITTPLFHVTATHPGFLLSIPAGAK